MKNKCTSIFLFIFFINAFLCINTKATDKICYQGNDMITIRYCGSYYGVDIYGNDMTKLNFIIPWLEKISKIYELNFELIIYDDLNLSLNELIIKNTETNEYELSQNFHVGDVQGLFGEYQQKWNRIVISSNLNDTIFQFTLIHELGHYIDSMQDLSKNLTKEQVEILRKLTELYQTGKNYEKENYTKNEAFAEMFLMQQVGIL